METALHQSGNILVTNTRTVVGGKTYAAKHITSIEAVVIPPNYTVKIMFSVIGFLMMAGGAVVVCIYTLSRDWIGMIVPLAFGFIGSVFLVAGIIYPIARPTYAVKLLTSAGEVELLQSPDEKLVDAVVRAVTKSIG